MKKMSGTKGVTWARHICFVTKKTPPGWAQPHPFSGGGKNCLNCGSKRVHGKVSQMNRVHEIFFFLGAVKEVPAERIPPPPNLS